MKNFLNFIPFAFLIFLNARGTNFDSVNKLFYFSNEQEPLIYMSENTDVDSEESLDVTDDIEIVKPPVDKDDYVFDPTDKEIIEWDYNIPMFYNQEYTINYFSNLDENKPINQNGCCGYVAFAMYLQFIDSYWNDNIIPEVYDKSINITTLDDSSFSQSPGTIAYKFLNENCTGQDVLSFHLNNKNYSFLGYLFDIATKVYNDDYYDKIDGTPLLSPLNSIAGVNFDIELKLIRRYLKESGFEDSIQIETYKKTNINYSTYVENPNLFFLQYNDIMSKIKSEVIAGKPLMVGGSLGINGGGHLIIIYDYNEETDTLYGNFGWENTLYNHYPINFNTFIPTDFYCFNDTSEFFLLDNNNYVYLGNETCAGKLNSHVHNCIFADYSSNMHQVLCSCSGYLENHYYDIKQYNPLVCMYCDHIKGKPEIGPGEPID